MLKAGMDHHIASLSSASAENSTLRRDSVVPPELQIGQFLLEYDFTTLWYDAISSGGKTRLICPKLLNFEALLQNGRLTIDGTPIPPRKIRNFRRHSLVELDATGENIALSHGDLTVQSPISPDASDRFAGLNVHVAISKDNDLIWLQDFARFHIQHHGLEAMILFDNGSDIYDVTAVSEALSKTGLKDWLVIPAPFRYGGRGLRPHGRTSKFLQTALFNVARLRYLQKARAVLQCDIDELIMTDGASIFDLAVQSRLGYIRFGGTWHTVPKDQPAPYRHCDNTQEAYENDPCPPKYCIVPGGPLRRFSWDVHGLERFPLGFRSKAAHHIHCQYVSNLWKGNTRAVRFPVTRPNPKVAALFEKTNWF